MIAVLDKIFAKGLSILPSQAYSPFGMSALVFHVTQTDGRYVAIAAEAAVRTEADSWDDLCRSAISASRVHLCCSDVSVILRPDRGLPYNAA